MTAQYRDPTYLSKEDQERIRSFVLHGMSCRELSWCAQTVRNQDGERFVTGATEERLHIGVDVVSMLRRMGSARRERLLSWALGIDPLDMMRPAEAMMVKEDMLRVQRFALRGGYAYLLGLDARIG